MDSQFQWARVRKLGDEEEKLVDRKADDLTITVEEKKGHHTPQSVSQTHNFLVTTKNNPRGISRAFNALNTD